MLIYIWKSVNVQCAHNIKCTYFHVILENYTELWRVLCTYMYMCIFKYLLIFAFVDIFWIRLEGYTIKNVACIGSNECKDLMKMIDRFNAFEVHCYWSYNDYHQFFFYWGLPDSFGLGDGFGWY